MKLIRIGATRWVCIIGNYAVKFPSLAGYRNFLQGLLANEQEVCWYRNFKWTRKLCPVVYSFPLHLFIVMPKVRVMTDHEAKEMWDWNEFDRAQDKQTPLDGFLTIEQGEPSQFPVEKKSDSFGWLNGKLVIIDYGT